MPGRLTLCTALALQLAALQPCGAQAPTPQSVVEAFRATYQCLSDYQCRTYEYCRQGNRYEERTMDVYFKKPRLIRMDVRKGNRFADTGSVGVYRGGDKVIGRKGGLLSFVVITVDKHDPQATTVRGLAFDESDLQATLEKMQFHLAESDCSLVAGAGLYELRFEARDPARNRGVTRDVIRLDIATLLPVSTDSYEGERHVQHAEWSAYILDAGLPDELFDVRWDAARLAGLGIRSVHELPLE